MQCAAITDASPTRRPHRPPSTPPRCHMAAVSTGRPRPILRHIPPVDRTPHAGVGRTCRCQYLFSSASVPPPPPLACRLLSLFSPLVLGARFRPQSRVPRHRSRVPRPPPRRGSTAKRVYRSVSRARIALLRPLPFSPGAYQAAPVTCTLTPGSGGRSRPSTRDTESAIPSLRGYPECRPERCCSRP